jgi:hypothetical protein
VRHGVTVKLSPEDAEEGVRVQIDMDPAAFEFPVYGPRSARFVVPLCEFLQGIEPAQEAKVIQILNDAVDTAWRGSDPFHTGTTIGGGNLARNILKGVTMDVYQIPGASNRYESPFAYPNWVFGRPLDQLNIDSAGIVEEGNVPDALPFPVRGFLVATWGRAS